MILIIAMIDCNQRIEVAYKLLSVSKSPDRYHLMWALTGFIFASIGLQIYS